MPSVPSHKESAVPHGGGGDDHVCIVNATPCGFSLRLEFPKLLHRLVIRVANREESQKRLHFLAVFIATFRLLHPIEQFTFDHGRYSQIVILVGIKKPPHYGLLPPKEPDANVRVEDRHSSTFLQKSGRGFFFPLPQSFTSVFPAVRSVEEFLAESHAELLGDGTECVIGNGLEFRQSG